MSESSRAVSKAEEERPSFTRAFWKAKTINEFESWMHKEVRRIGHTYCHRKPRPFETEMRLYRNLDDISASVVEEAHTTTIYLHAILNPQLYRIYMLDNQLGGKADPNWAWRPGIWWTFCEDCETLWTMPYERPFPLGIHDIFPMNYFPGEQILQTIRSWCQVCWGAYDYAEVIGKVLYPSWL